MLLWFRFNNYGPFRDEAFFDLRAVKEYKELPGHVMSAAGQEAVVRTAAVYGANASGKTNLIRALYSYTEIVMRSMDHVEQSDQTPLAVHYHPYQFRPGESKQPTEMEAAICLLGMEYQYGFTYDDKQIYHEWLYLNQPNEKQEVLFERSGSQVEFGEIVNREEAKTFLSGLDDNMLLVTLFDRLRLSDRHWKYAKLAVRSIFVYDTSELSDINVMLPYLRESLLDDNKLQWVTKQVQEIDVNICRFLVERGSEPDRAQVFTIHQDADGREYRMPLEEESQGTLKTMAMLFLYHTTENPCTFVFDELNTHLHPLLLKFFVDLFYQSDKQLIFVTHDTTLLDRRYLRRDQVWFVEKDKENCASLYSLAEFKVRNDASFGKGYLAGQYGAIPILREGDLTS